MHEQELQQQAALLGAPVTDEQAAQLARYQALLAEWNERLNLTAITDPGEVRVRHFLDSLSVASVAGDLNGQRLIDIGTGAGFPGLPLRIVYPQMGLTLVESVTKKTRFLEEVVRELGLTDVTISDERAETLGQQSAHREQYDWAVARAVAEMRVLAEYLLPFCRVGGRMLAMKGQSAPEEVKSAGHAVELLGGSAPQLHEVHLPGREEVYYLVLSEKVRETPPDYPRRPGRPAKRPL
ncbi:MAG: 16S rRNA (guanine(527)-N(7))-methyltransferase RsmG [Candidatus Promineifilaceae bacterium]|nr:16S rRNA (guanine(527)-N(7))-methyltransferase RsmG [Candidatus Promineifilaceae bacterium]